VSTEKFKILESPADVRKKLKLFVDKNFAGRQKSLAENLKTGEAKVSYWLNTGGMPAEALLNILRLYPEEAHAAFFSNVPDKRGAKPLEVADPEGEWMTPKKMRVIREVKDLMRDADEEAINALLENLKIFRRAIANQKR
jgi:hypothetical protein